MAGLSICEVRLGNLNHVGDAGGPAAGHFGPGREAWACGLAPAWGWAFLRCSRELPSGGAGNMLGRQSGHTNSGLFP